MKIFKCKHKFKHLVVNKDSTEHSNKDYPKLFNTVIYHLYCMNCNTKLDLSYAKMIVSTEDFLKSKTL